jgi:hypothetical protein
MNPQTVLFKMLAESNIRHQQITQAHGRSLATIPQRQEQMQAEISQLRSHIQDIGIGADLKAEDRYLKLLEQWRSLHQSYAMGNPAKAAEEPEETSEELFKALDWGELLLSVYGGGALVKGASGDIEAAVRRLETVGGDRALKLTGKLRAIASF